MRPLAILLFYVLFSPAGCKDKNVQPNFPPRLSNSQKQDILQKWTKGKLLFKTNCSRCHGVFTKGKDSIPNFTKVQIDRYASRFLARDPKNHAVIKQLSNEDFNNVVIFLTYLKRTNPTGPTPGYMPNPRGMPPGR